MKFAVTLEQDEDGYIVVSCPALPGCHSQGKTREEAIANIREAIQAYIASMRKHGEPIPQKFYLLSPQFHQSKTAHLPFSIKPISVYNILYGQHKH